MRLSNKALNVFLILFLSVACTAWAQTTSTDRMSIGAQKVNDISKNRHYSINVSYPMLKNVAHSKEANQLIKHHVDAMIASFKKEIPNYQKPIEGLPLTDESNSMSVKYAITAASRHFISIRWEIYTNYYGAAHPMTTFESLNYDLDAGRVLSLSDIFNVPDYLAFISNLSTKQLTQKLSKAASSSIKPDKNGLKPVAKNFAIWNVTQKGLLLTFPPYQVAAYVFGPQEVFIPYQVIQNKLKPNWWSVKIKQ